MKKYKVFFKGFAYVEASSAEEANNKYQEDFAYAESSVVKTEEVEDFEVEDF